MAEMRQGIRAARVALFVMAALLLGAGVAAAQVDLAKALVGRGRGRSSGGRARRPIPV